MQPQHACTRTARRMTLDAEQIRREPRCDLMLLYHAVWQLAWANYIVATVSYYLTFS